MRAGSEARRAIVGAIVGLLYGSVLGFLSLAAAAAGHGTLIPLFLSSAPLSVFYLVAHTNAGREGLLFAMLFGGPFVWAALGWLIALPGRGKRGRYAQVLLLLHYASGLALVARAGLADLKLVPEIVVVWAAIYLVGQVASWWRISRRNQPTV